jgi:DNA-directed RNA polymerase subunit RPC12/RpoP
MAAPTSGLPSLMMPCPTCAGRVVYHSRRIAAPDMEDTIYACRGCGTEVIRTSMSKAKGAEAA